MIKQATIVQYTHNKQEVYTVNDVVISSKISSREHHYQIKFNHDNEDEFKFVEFVFEKGGTYLFEDDKNLGELPEEYYCWCSCMEDFLSKNGYTPINVGEKTDVWEVKRRRFNRLTS